MLPPLPYVKRTKPYEQMTPYAKHTIPYAKHTIPYEQIIPYAKHTIPDAKHTIPNATHDHGRSHINRPTRGVIISSGQKTL